MISVESIHPKSETSRENIACLLIFIETQSFCCLSILDDLLATGYAVGFDLVFIDVNMILEDNSYKYYEFYWRSLALLRQGGLLVLNAVSDDVNHHFFLSGVL